MKAVRCDAEHTRYLAPATVSYLEQTHEISTAMTHSLLPSIRVPATRAAHHQPYGGYGTLLHDMFVGWRHTYPRVSTPVVLHADATGSQ